LEQLETISSGLFLEREQGIYSFAHLTFQEYLAMVYLQENHLEQNLPSLVEESWWHEVIRLYCAQAEATSILEACLAVASNSFEALTLAIDCAEEARNVQTAVKERLSILLEQGVNDSDSKRRRVIMEAPFSPP
jgi:predicted NACHT family NTPase